MPHDVLVDLTPLDTWSRFTGTGRYIVELGRALAALTPSERESLDIGALTGIRGPHAIGPLTWPGSEQPLYGEHEELRWLMARRLRLPLTVGRLRPRLLHTPYSLGTPRGAFVPRVVTCLDLVRLVMPGEYLEGRRIYRSLLHAAEAARFHAARRVITISQFTADDVVRLLRVPASRIDAVPLGVDLEQFRPPRAGPESVAAAAIRRQHRLEERPYLVHLGAADARKNVDTLIRAFARAALRDIDLVLVGRLPPAHLALVERILAEVGRPPNVRLLGFVPDEHLPAILAGALGLPFTSSYEGFGFAPLEAMACGCPVIATGKTSIGEVVGDAALLVAPRDEEALATALRRLASEPSLARDLRTAGLARAARFTWRETALGTVASYVRALRD
jgi:glycosyltransferase involved in cell wall biosynthesis